jgi:hypothetical protein
MALRHSSSTPFGQNGDALGGVHRLVAASGSGGLARICIGVGPGLAVVAEA